MTSHHVHDQIDAWVDGTLPTAMRAAFEHHLGGCAECRLDVDAARTLRSAVASLPRAIDPPSDLWPAVQSRLASRAAVHRTRLPARWRTAGLAAAAALALMVGSSAATLWVVRHRAGSAATAAQSTPAIEAGYVSASAALLRALEREREHLSPETVATLERNLAIIDAAIAESRTALAGDPGNSALASLLWASYRQKVALLEQVNRLVERT
jgi:hypothetical protein